MYTLVHPDSFEEATSLAHMPNGLGVFNEELKEAKPDTINRSYLRRADPADLAFFLAHDAVIFVSVGTV